MGLVGPTEPQADLGWKGGKLPGQTLGGVDLGAVCRGHQGGGGGGLVLVVGGLQGGPSKGLLDCGDVEAGPDGCGCVRTSTLS